MKRLSDPRLLHFCLISKSKTQLVKWCEFLLQKKKNTQLPYRAFHQVLADFTEEASIIFPFYRKETRAWVGDLPTVTHEASSRAKNRSSSPVLCPTGQSSSLTQPFCVRCDLYLSTNLHYLSKRSKSFAIKLCYFSQFTA